MKEKLVLLPVVIIFFLLGGCTLAPKYTRPASPVPDQLPKSPAYQDTRTGTAAPTAAELSWREFITDKKMQKIVETALKNNRDLRIAALNVERARAYYGISRAELLPSVNAAGSMYKERMPGDLSSTGSAMTTEKYSVNMGISSWEIDFFGRIRSLKDKALEQYLATQEAHRGAQISLISVVAQAYLTLAADKENLNMVISTLETQEASYKLIRKRCDAGIASEIDLKRAQSQVDTARGDVARYKQLTVQDENFLNLLTGSTVPQEFLPQDLISVGIPKDISPGLSSELLLRRPDILAAEHQLKAANANIGAARAAFFPRIALTTTIGTASTELSGLFKAGQGTWTFAPQIVMPIFDARTWSAYDVTKVEKEISVAQYEKAIQTAFREVADALAEKSMVDQRLSAQQSLVDAVAETHRLANSRYTKGIDSYLSVLDAQRSLYGAKQVLTILRLTKINNQIILYKTLGGGKEN
ncbi:MAG: multidrug transporter [Deltaproteobacteria bacterium HGW-Deltaproteobacteria-2]|jgi:multidrug efflux system outer membrane protein|nr:MAG: multidrug transporter [Deltaproteobacteria bacterium HGW-Deltaproteobacteria-2]